MPRRLVGIVWLYDHFHTLANAFRGATHEAWTLMPAIAASTLSHAAWPDVYTQCRTGIWRTGPRSRLPSTSCRRERTEMGVLGG
jgi:hypothetical protein